MSKINLKTPKLKKRSIERKLTDKEFMDIMINCTTLIMEMDKLSLKQKLRAVETLNTVLHKKKDMMRVVSSDDENSKLLEGDLTHLRLIDPSFYEVPVIEVNVRVEISWENTGFSGLHVTFSSLISDISIKVENKEVVGALYTPA